MLTVTSWFVFTGSTSFEGKWALSFSTLWWGATDKKKHKKPKSFCYLLLFFSPAQKFVKDIPTSSFRGTIQNAFISWTRSSTCQVGPVRLIKEVKTTRRINTYLLFFLFKKPTYLLALWIFFPTVTDTQGEKVSVFTSVSCNKFLSAAWWHRHIYKQSMTISRCLKF